MSGGHAPAENFVEIHSALSASAALNERHGFTFPLILQDF